MAMTTITDETRTRFYRQESDPGSHLSPAYNQDVLRDLLSWIAQKPIRQIADLGSGSGSNLSTLRGAFNRAKIITLDINGPALVNGRNLSPDVLPAVSDAAAPLSARAAKKKRQLSLKPSSASGGAPTISVPLLLTKSAKKKLRQKGKVKAKARITFTPTGGTTGTQTATLKIKGKKPKKR